MIEGRWWTRTAFCIVGVSLVYFISRLLFCFDMLSECCVLRNDHFAKQIDQSISCFDSKDSTYLRAYVKAFFCNVFHQQFLKLRRLSQWHLSPRHIAVTWWPSDVVWYRSGGRLNKKDGLTRYGNSHVKDKTAVRTWKSPYVDKTVFILRRGPGLS